MDRGLEEGHAAFQPAPRLEQTSSEPNPPHRREQRELKRIRSRLRYRARRDRWRAFIERWFAPDGVKPLKHNDGSDDVASESDIWLRTTQDYREGGGQLHASTLAWWWREWPKDEIQSTGDAFEALLDLNFGPVATPEPRRGLWWRGPVDGDGPPGLKLRQAVFVAGQRQFASQEYQLDDFCRSVAGLDSRTRCEGVVCLAGVRGSGKSTILNRIAWYCRQPFKDHRSPLCIQFDLSMAFAHERFARDLVDQICREARKYCDEGPFAWRKPPITTMVTAVGEVGRWCETNVKWAGITLLLLFGLIGASQLYDPQRTSSAGAPSAHEVANQSAPNLQSASSAAAADRSASGTATTQSAANAAPTDRSAANTAAAPNQSDTAAAIDQPDSMAATDQPDSVAATDQSASGTASTSNQPPAEGHQVASGAAGRLRFPNGEMELPLVGKWKIADIHLLGLALVAVLAMGGAHALHRVLCSSRVPGPSFGRQWLAALVLVGPTLVAADAIYLWVATEPAEWRSEAIEWKFKDPAPLPGFHLAGVVLAAWGVGEAGKKSLSAFSVDVKPDGNKFALAENQDWYTALVLPFCASILLIGCAIVALPQWWQPYLLFRKLSHQLQAPDDGRLVPLPYLGAILAQVLPKSEDYEELDKISMPFLQSRTRQVLEQCVRAFGRVVIIVDDVDILPSTQYHELLRLLRPVSKVPGVYCVLAVPGLFHDVWTSSALNDAHSTISQCIVVGDPEFYRIDRGVPKPFTDSSRERLRTFLIELMCARLTVPLADQVEPHDLTYNPFFADALRHWKFDGSGTSLELAQEERQFLDQKGLSRREWLRAIRKRLPAALAGTPERARELLDLEVTTERNYLAGSRRDIEEIENLFRCEAHWWSNFAKATGAVNCAADSALVLKAPDELLVRVKGVSGPRQKPSAGITPRKRGSEPETSTEKQNDQGRHHGFT
jgi:hypothetical protein